MTITQENKIKINYKFEGLENADSSPLIWLTHGAGGDLYHFDTVVPVLVANGFRVLRMDVRYHGLSQPDDLTNVTYKFSDVIQDMNGVLEEVKEKYYSHYNKGVSLLLAGFSMGGMISLLSAADMVNDQESWNNYGFVLKGIIAMASGIPLMEVERPGWDIYRDRTATLEILQFTKASIVASSLTELGKQETERAMKLISDPALYECLVEVATFFPPPSDPPRRYVPATNLPILLIWPDHDAYTKQELELLHTINLEHGITSKLVVIKDAGHMVVLDKGVEVAENIIEFRNTIL